MTYNHDFVRSVVVEELTTFSYHVSDECIDAIVQKVGNYIDGVESDALDAGYLDGRSE